MADGENLQISGNQGSFEFPETKLQFIRTTGKNENGQRRIIYFKRIQRILQFENIEIEYSTPRIHTGTEAVERAIQTLKTLIITNLEENIGLTECVNRTLNVMSFTIHTGMKITPLELHHGCKPRTELTNIIKDGRSFFSNWSELPSLANERPKIPIYRNGDGEVSNHIVMARTEENAFRKKKTEEKTLTEKSPKKKNSVGINPFQFFEKNHNKKSLEGRFQKKLQTAISGTEQTVTTDTGKVIHRKFISGPIVFQKERKAAPKIGDNITPKNRHCLRGVDGKYIQWNEVLRDVLNGKLKIVPSQRTGTDTESEEGEIDDDESDFENHDTSEKDGVYRPVTTSPEDELNLHTDGELNTGEIKLENNTTENERVRRSSRESKQPNRYEGVTYTKKLLGVFVKQKTVTGERWNIRKEPPKPLTKPADFTREKTPTPGTSKQ